MGREASGVVKEAGKLDILFVGGLPPFRAGSAISTFQLLDRLARRGHAVRAAGPITPDTRADGERFAAGQRRVEISWFELPYFDFTPDIPAPEAYRRLEYEAVWRTVPDQIRERRPDVVIVGHESWAWHIPALAQDYDLPCVQLVRGNPVRGILNGTYPTGAAQQLLGEFRKAQLIVCVARYMAEGLAQLGFANVTWVWNAVDTQQFAPRPKSPALLRELGIEQDDLVVAHVATAKAIKRPMDVVESAQRALTRNPRLVYLMVGDGSLRADLERECRARRIYDRFRFVGWVDYARVPDYINLADIVVLPSEGEGLARVYVETQACGRVLLASDILSAREVIEDGITGLLFAGGDVDDLAAKTLLAAASPALVAAIGRKAREQAEARHRLEEAVDRYETLLTETARQRERRLVEEGGRHGVYPK